jgi:hypothetical protein
MNVTRKEQAAERLAYARRLSDDARNNSVQVTQAIDAWMHVATVGEIRRGWRKSWGHIPSWAEARA